MDEAGMVEVSQGEVQRDTQFQALPQRQSRALEQDFGKRPGHVGLGVEPRQRRPGFRAFGWAAGGRARFRGLHPCCIVRQLHHVIEIAFSIVAANLKDVNEPFIAPGERLKFLNAVELPLIRSGIQEPVAKHHLHGAPGAYDTPGQPNIAVAPAADAPQEFVVGHDRLEGCNPGGLAGGFSRRRAWSFQWHGFNRWFPPAFAPDGGADVARPCGCPGALRADIWQSAAKARCASAANGLV